MKHKITIALLALGLLATPTAVQGRGHWRGGGAGWDYGGWDHRGGWERRGWRHHHRHSWGYGGSYISFGIFPGYYGAYYPPYASPYGYYGGGYPYVPYRYGTYGYGFPAFPYGYPGYRRWRH